MKTIFTYHPIPFFLITILTSLALGPIAAYLSYRNQVEKILPLLTLNLFIPCITALIMIYCSGSKEMVHDFWVRLLLFKIQPSYLAVIVLLMPMAILLATMISLVFGYSSDQFHLAKQLSVMKGWSLLGILVPLLLAPLIEELGWRGYGIDSLRAYTNLFTTSVIFGILWGLWHLPLFFIKGYYQNQLWDLGLIHVLNFFVSVFVVAFLMNWVYYQTNRSIPAIILFHSILNLSSILFRTEPVTKCIATVLLCIVLIFILVKDRVLFFDKSFKTNLYEKALTTKFSHKLNQHLDSELNLLRNRYHFPGATVSYVLPDGTVGTVATGLADIENGQPMTAESRMLAASVGKTFVAATVIALAKEGHLSLDDPLSNWLGVRSWFTRLPNYETITLRHLLTHSSGLPDHTKMTDFVKLFSDKRLQVNHIEIAELLVGLILDHSPLFEVGKGWYYTDTGYILLGLVIEAVTGNGYYDEIDRRFLKPLALDQTSPSDQPALRSLVAGYTSENNFFHLPLKTVNNEGVMVWDPVIEWTGGGLISNSCDLARWAKLLYGGRAMPVDYLGDLLQSVPTDNDTSKISYGLGVAIEKNTPLGMWYGHGGVIPGYTSSMRYYCQYGIAIAFQINTDKGVSDHSTELVNDMEQRLAEIVINLWRDMPYEMATNKDSRKVRSLKAYLGL